MKTRHERPRSCPKGALALVCALLGGGCGGPAGPGDQPPPYAPFTVRGRWPAGHTLRYRIEEAGGPLAREAFSAAILEALEEWREAGGLDFEPAPEGTTADVTFGWRSGGHDECPPFGGDSRVAHTGPVVRGTFVHFDADRPWSERSEDRGSLFHAALHETGHVLGLGHSPDPGAVMYAGYTADPSRPASSDRAGIASLYGGGIRSSSDLVILAQGASGPDLRGIAPPNASDFAVFDTDGDGDQELIVWRTDFHGHGTVMIYSFSAGCLLTGTAGPLMGMVGPGVLVDCGVTPDEQRVIVSYYPGGHVVAREFEYGGWMSQAEGVDADTPLTNPDGRHAGDLDGDGLGEKVSRASSE